MSTEIVPGTEAPVVETTTPTDPVPNVSGLPLTVGVPSTRPADKTGSRVATKTMAGSTVFLVADSTTVTVTVTVYFKTALLAELPEPVLLYAKL
jgi:hypothetical protein